ncbi:hypothetical protein FAZ19_05465 [Sphingobacterium alkalisoli]|uniref:LiaI-LiaF-like transmembrane region domain-containing protein n=1 Tax=Sphingobacterium alkalisoli TaxID=1874115 RepID=A0A4U0H9V1_9SPHI|nr:DUF5668 domain-containing protein [Sphingobacterium alkalisoli]TJY68703.1 hypothetical protein FAZ19_05465 [Sphingobacterium alkalisoli]GGH04685.1 hypothetical protein GCM10011418_00480 [Sphingobacterium alkalisoli]
MNSKITTGIWFIFFGIIILLHNFGVVNFNFYAIFKYWPLIIVAIGANLILQNRKFGTLITSIINVAICIFLMIIGLTSSEKFSFNNFANINIENSNDTLGLQQVVSLPFTDDIQKVGFEVNAGATALLLDSHPSEELIKASSPSGNMGLKLKVTGENPLEKIELINKIKNDSSPGNTINFALNKNPIWNMEFNIGASSFKGDLSAYKLAYLSINSGAASIDLTFGQPNVGITTIEINTAASSCKIQLPKSAACMIENDSFLSGKKFKGLDIKEGNKHKTTNFDNEENKYIIKITGAANSLSINRF